nr:immunoglobulin heavy chain junction region [Homo sapiens]
EPRTRLCITVR